MIYLALKNSVGIEGNIAKFERSFLQPGGLHIVYQQENKGADTIQLAIYTETLFHNDLVRVLARNYFKHRVMGFQLAANKPLN
ncbi:MAG: hypothetical protein AB1489_37730 [Acidobacteriota bacterium]